MEGDFGVPFLRKELGSKDRVMAAQAMLALGEKRASDGFSDALRLLEADTWQIVAAAAHALHDMRGPIPDEHDDKPDVVFSF